MSVSSEPMSVQLTVASAARLRAAGFGVAVVPDTIAAPVRALAGRTFVLGDAALTVVTRDDHHVEVPYDQVDVLVRGSALTRHTATETTTTRKLDVGRAVLTGGLMMTRKHKTKHTTTTTDSHATCTLRHVARALASSSAPVWMAGP